MRYRLFVFLLINSSAYGQATYSSIKPIVDQHCVRCHGSNGEADFLPFESLDQIRTSRSRMISALTEDFMPYDRPGFVNTQEGQLLLDWLRNGLDLDGPGDGIPSLIERDPRTLTFAEIEPILRARCQGCHAPGRRMARRPLTTLSEVRRKADDAWDQLDDAEMPPDDPDFAFSIDGRVLAGWLRYGRDIADDGNRDDDHDD